MTMLKQCVDCGTSYQTQHSWKVRCVPCWRKMKLEEGGSDIVATRTTRIDPKMLRKAIQLCHPDKHRNSATSQEVTAYLLELRREAG